MNNPSSHPIGWLDQPTEHSIAASPAAIKRVPLAERNWIFRTTAFAGRCISTLFGILSVIFLLAVTANIPIAQFMSFGYLLEVSGRLARQQRYRDAFIGLRKASKIGVIVLGSWLLLWPVRLASMFWLEAYIIDPNSTQQNFLRGFNYVLIGLVVAHIFSAIVCGGKLRYFFWPIIAPASFAVWVARRSAGVPLLRRTLDLSIGWLSPKLVNDLCAAEPIGDWFLPAIMIKKIRSGTLFAEARDRLWNFVASLNLWYYLQFGFKGFLGSLAWLILPTYLLVRSTSLEGPQAALFGIIGGLIAIPVFSILPFVQAHYATDGKLKRFVEVRTVLRNLGRAPLAHLIALLLTLLLALPLFLLKIEEIPGELLWSLSLVFVVFIWPAKWIVGWAYRRGALGEKRRKWWIRYPIWAAIFAISLSFVFIMFFTRYITWNGAASLIENHVFLLPSPFWLDLK